MPQIAKVTEKRPLRKPKFARDVNIKMILNKYDIVVWATCWSDYEHVACCCENGNESSGNEKARILTA
jgi:hypothetical protein